MTRRDPATRHARILSAASAIVLLGSVLVVALGPAAGATFHLFETPQVLQVHVSGGGSPVYPSSPTYAAPSPNGVAEGVTFVPPLHEFVASIGGWYGPGALYPVGEGVPPASSWQVVCHGRLGPVFYPGGGPTLYTQCQTGANTSLLLEVNDTTLRPAANVSLGTGDLVTAYAEDPAAQLLFCLTWHGLLSIVNLTGQEQVVQVQLPGANAGAQILWFDQADSHLLAADPGNDSLLVVDPATGETITTVPLPGNVTAIVGDPYTRSVYLTYCGGSYCTYPYGVAVLSAQALSAFVDVPTPFGDLYFAAVDPSHGEVDLSAGEDVLVLNESRNQLVDSSGSLPSAGAIALDPSSGTFDIGFEGGSDCQSGCENFGVESRNYSTPAPFSAIPLFGSGTPAALGVIGAVVGASLLVTRGILFPRVDGDLPPLPGARQGPAPASRRSEPPLTGGPPATRLR